MRIEYTPHRIMSSSPPEYRYRVMIQDGWLYFNDLDHAIREALAYAGPNDTVQLPDGTFLQRKETSPLDKLFQEQAKFNQAALDTQIVLLKIAKEMAHDMAAVATMLRDKARPGSPECAEAQRIMTKWSGDYETLDKAIRELASPNGAGSGAGVPAAAEVAAGTADAGDKG